MQRDWGDTKAFDLSPNAMAQLLKSLGDPQLLGGSPLANLPMVDRLIHQLDLRDTPATRGLALAMIIEDLITERASNAPPTQSLWWKVLQTRYRESQPLNQIANELAISSRSASRHSQTGLVLLAKALLDVLIEDAKNRDVP